MKMKVTVNGRSYDVEVEVLDPSSPLPSAGLRVEGSAVLNPPPSPKPHAPGAPPSRPVAPTAPAAKAPSAAPIPVAWHGLGSGDEGVLVSPLAGVVGAVQVKVGDSVRAGDPIASLAASHVLSPGERPLTGTVRAPRAGTIREVMAQAGDAVAAGQPLVRLA